MSSPLADILVINGPNLNMIGTREPEIYGHTTFADIEKPSREEAASLGVSLDWMQSNHEGEIVTRIQSAVTHNRALVINAAAYTHTSIALRDALGLFSGPKIEIHISNIHRRETFRHRSMIIDMCDGTVAGFGAMSYQLGIRAAAHLLSSQ